LGLLTGNRYPKGKLLDSIIPETVSLHRPSPNGAIENQLSPILFAMLKFNQSFKNNSGFSYFWILSNISILLKEQFRPNEAPSLPIGHYQLKYKLDARQGI